MTTSVREFLETYPLHEKLQSRAAELWRGDWPDVVDAHCLTCRAIRPYWIWPSRVASFTSEWGVYMLTGTCETCCTTRLLYWVEVNPREGWMQKAGQLPPPMMSDRKANVTSN
ncbi:MAG TPA: hypothetical protein VGQ06_01085 [Gemmatimonadales bacterium]|jgi:hypothetical protein|nr:hypothetical protein [Gemmatimonadales bacterium]